MKDFMKHTLSAAVVAVCLLLASIAPGAQSKPEQLKDYSRVLPGLDVTLTLVPINDRTAPLLFEAPTLYSMRARAKDATLLYVQGKAERDIQIDTTNFRVTQAGQTATAAPTNITNFAKGDKVKVPLGGQINGVLVFPKLFDPSKPFTVLHDRDTVEFKFNPDQVKGMTAAPAAQ
jgi:hypothetical protein